MSVNKVFLDGNLGADPELVDTGAVRLCNLRLATSRSWMDKTTNEWREETEWHRVVVFGNLVDTVMKYGKGDLIHIEGRLRTRQWHSQSGETHTTTEIVVDIGGTAKMLHRRSPASTDTPVRQTRPRPAKPVDEQPDFDDEIPF